MSIKCQDSGTQVLRHVSMDEDGIYAWCGCCGLTVPVVMQRIDDINAIKIYAQH